MPFGLWSRKVEATVEDRQKQDDVNYATSQLEQGNLRFIVGDATDFVSCSSDRTILSLQDVSLMESRLAQKRALLRKPAG